MNGNSKWNGSSENCLDERLNSNDCIIKSWTICQKSRFMFFFSSPDWHSQTNELKLNQFTIQIKFSGKLKSMLKLWRSEQKRFFLQRNEEKKIVEASHRIVWMSLKCHNWIEKQWKKTFFFCRNNEKTSRMTKVHGRKNNTRPRNERRWFRMNDACSKLKMNWCMHTLKSKVCQLPK